MDVSIEGLLILRSRKFNLDGARGRIALVARLITSLNSLYLRAMANRAMYFEVQ